MDSIQSTRKRYFKFDLNLPSMHRNPPEESFDSDEFEFETFGAEDEDINDHWPIRKCECGATKAGTPFHARWCVLYKDPMKKDK